MNEPSSTYAYPQDEVRIAATYPSARDGETPPAGQPETVDIIINGPAVPIGSAERVAFVTSLVDSLFRGDRAEYRVQIGAAVGRELDAAGGVR